MLAYRGTRISPVEVILDGLDGAQLGLDRPQGAVHQVLIIPSDSATANV